MDLAGLDDFGWMSGFWVRDVRRNGELGSYFGGSWTAFGRREQSEQVTRITNRQAKRYYLQKFYSPPFFVIIFDHLH
jgi:hypothetical protein